MSDIKPLDLFENGVSVKLDSEEPLIPAPEEIEHKMDLAEETKEQVVSCEMGSGDIDMTEEVGEKSSFDKEMLTSVEDTANEEYIKEGRGETLARLESMYERLLDQISSMESLFKKRIMHTEFEDKIIDQMHAELQKYKEDLYSQLLRPILLDIIEVRDSIMKNSFEYLEKPEGEQAIPNKIFASYAYDLQDILEKNNVEIYRSEVGEPFVPGRQRMQNKESTKEESLHGKVAKSLSCGYSYGGRVISVEKVSVYTHEK